MVYVKPANRIGTINHIVLYSTIHVIGIFFQGLCYGTTPIRVVALSIVTKTPLIEAHTPNHAPAADGCAGPGAHAAIPPSPTPPQVWRAPRAHFKRPEAQGSDLLQRLDALHSNSLEGLPILFGCVLTAIVAGVPAAQIDGAAVTYLLSRVVYAAAYLASSKKRPWMGLVRTAAFAAAGLLQAHGAAPVGCAGAQGGGVVGARTNCSARCTEDRDVRRGSSAGCVARTIRGPDDCTL